MHLESIQTALQQAGLDGWLFFDHHYRDPLAYKILGLPEDVMASRRWYYLLPAKGDPTKLVHRIESANLDALPGKKLTYSTWNEQRTILHSILQSRPRLAMQYSPLCNVPYVSMVDAGTVELVRSFGVELFTSADLIQQFEARWTGEQVETHLEAGRRVDRIRQEAFAMVSEHLKNSVPLNEFQVQEFISKSMTKAELTAKHPAIVAVNSNASNPHYSPSRDSSWQIRAGDVLLIDLWGKLMLPNAVYYDITWVAYCGKQAPDKVRNVFETVRDARKLASEFVRKSVEQGAAIQGFQVDDVARTHIDNQRFGDYFFHRLGHSIGTEVHGNGANMDNYESHDERRITSQTCFSIEPGIYLPEFGIRSEVNVYVSEKTAIVTGEEQDHLLLLQ